MSQNSFLENCDPNFALWGEPGQRFKYRIASFLIINTDLSLAFISVNYFVTLGCCVSTGPCDLGRSGQLPPGIPLVFFLIISLAMPGVGPHGETETETSM